MAVELLEKATPVEVTSPPIEFRVADEYHQHPIVASLEAAFMEAAYYAPVRSHPESPNVTESIKINVVPAFIELCYSLHEALPVEAVCPEDAYTLISPDKRIFRFVPVSQNEQFPDRFRGASWELKRGHWVDLMPDNRRESTLCLAEPQFGTDTKLYVHPKPEAVAIPEAVPSLRGFNLLKYPRF